MAKLNADSVSNFLQGKLVENMLSRPCFQNKDEFYRQSPNCALGSLSYVGPSGFGLSENWMTEDGKYWVAINPSDCTIVRVRLNKNYIEKL